MSDIDEMNVGERWYVAHTYSGYENKVKASLEKIVENRGLGHLIFDVRVPVEIVTELNGDVAKEKEVKLFPSYVFVKMIMTEESWHAVRNITGVTGFVGPGSRPTPLAEEDLSEELKTALKIETTRVELKFKVGDNVVITDEGIGNHTGVVQAISDDLKTVTVILNRGSLRLPMQIDASKIKLV